MGEALLQALTMPPDEQRERMRRMREMVRDNNVYPLGRLHAAGCRAHPQAVPRRTCPPG